MGTVWCVSVPPPTPALHQLQATVNVSGLGDFVHPWRGSVYQEQTTVEKHRQRQWSFVHADEARCISKRK